MIGWVIKFSTRFSAENCITSVGENRVGEKRLNKLFGKNPYVNGRSVDRAEEFLFYISTKPIL